MCALMKPPDNPTNKIEGVIILTYWMCRVQCVAVCCSVLQCVYIGCGGCLIHIHAHAYTCSICNSETKTHVCIALSLSLHLSLSLSLALPLARSPSPPLAFSLSL